MAFTVRAMDAGPVLTQERVAVDDVIQAPQLLDDLFRRGTELLIRHLPLVWEGRAREQAQPQVRAAQLEHFQDFGESLAMQLQSEPPTMSTVEVQKIRTAAFL